MEQISDEQTASTPKLSIHPQPSLHCHRHAVAAYQRDILASSCLFRASAGVTRVNKEGSKTGYVSEQIFNCAVSSRANCSWSNCLAARANWLISWSRGLGLEPIPSTHTPRLWQVCLRADTTCYCPSQSLTMLPSSPESHGLLWVLFLTRRQREKGKRP